MTKTDTISIDGQAYDALTGLPVSESASLSDTSTENLVVKRPSSTATKLHGGPQRSVTLQRKFVKKPVPLKHQIVKHASAKHMDIARPAQTAHRNGTIRKFAPHPAGALAPKVSADIAPVTHPHVAKAHSHSAALATPVRTPSASEVKENIIRNAIANTHKKPRLKDRLKVRQRTASIVGATVALVLLAGYFTYLNMPALSVRVAAAQAGIDAGYPNYRPDGYALNGPVTYSDGKVAMNFKANGGDDTFTISQSKSGWDSEALLDNYVTPKAGSDYVPYTERGLTIYTFGDNAAWVNGGILYTIEGNAPLSSSQMRRIATSLL